MKKEKIVAIIPARGGSKGIPRKNIKLLNGKPMISYIIKSALAVKEIDRVIVSTDDDEIANISKEYGAEVPFIRPPELAEDSIPTTPVLQHAIKWLKDNENYDADIVVLLYATSPLLKSEKIKEAIEKINGNKNVDSVVSGCMDDKYHWKIEKKDLIRFYPKKLVNRQFMNPLFRENGAIYISRKHILENTDKYIGGKIDYIIMDEKNSWDIDKESDFEIVEALMKQKSEKSQEVQ